MVFARQNRSNLEFTRTVKIGTLSGTYLVLYPEKGGTYGVLFQGQIWVEIRSYKINLILKQGHFNAQNKIFH